MKIESIKISKLDKVSIIEINGEQLERVIDYKIKSSAHGTTELWLQLDMSDTVIEFDVLNAYESIFNSPDAREDRREVGR